MKKFTLTILFILVFVTAMFVPMNAFAAGDNVIPNDETGIPDKALYKAILKEGDVNEDGVLTKDEAVKITALDASNVGVKKLEGIENLTEMTELWAGNNQLDTLTDIGSLPKLTYLRINNNQLTNLAGIENLTSLSILHVNNNKLTSLPEIKNLTALNTLVADDNEITDLEGIKDITGMKKLWINNNKLTNLSGIENLTTLNFLHAANNQLTSIVGIESLSELDMIDVYGNQLTSLPDMTKLTYLSCDYCYDEEGKIRITDFSSDFRYNYLTAEEFNYKLPAQLLADTDWLQAQIAEQNLLSDSDSSKVVNPKTGENESWIVFTVILIIASSVLVLSRKQYCPSKR